MEKEQDLQQQKNSDATNEPVANVEGQTGETPASENGSATLAPDAGPSPNEPQQRFLRLAADFANYKRRSENERADIADWARRDFALALLPILDDFGLMIEYETTHPERLAEGAKLIRQKMMDLLIRHGLEKIEALNQPYDYAAHEAVLSQPVQDVALDHIVLSVMQEGYRFKGKVLRPSKVIVGQASAGSASSSASTDSAAESAGGSANSADGSAVSDSSPAASETMEPN